MKNIFFLIISGSFIFLPIDVFGEDRNLIKLDVTGDCARCNLESANLSEKDLSGADLSGANLENTILRKITTAKTIFCNTKFPWGIDNSGC